MSEQAPVPSGNLENDPYQSIFWKMLGKIGKWSLIVFSAIMLLTVTVFDPLEVSIWLFGLDPSKPVAELVVGDSLLVTKAAAVWPDRAESFAIPEDGVTAPFVLGVDNANGKFAVLDLSDGTGAGSAGSARIAEAAAAGARGVVLVNYTVDTLLAPETRLPDFDTSIPCFSISEEAGSVLAANPGQTLTIRPLRGGRGSVDAQTMAVMNGVSNQSVRRHYEGIVTDGSRAVGYPGEAAARDYIISEFQRFGLQDIRVDTFAVVTPFDKGGSVVFGDGATGSIDALWPNHIKPPTLPRAELSIGGEVVAPLAAVWTDEDLADYHTVPSSGVVADFIYIQRRDLAGQTLSDVVGIGRGDGTPRAGELGVWNIIDYSQFDVAGKVVVLDIVGTVSNGENGTVNVDSVNIARADAAGAVGVIIRDYEKTVLLNPEEATPPVRGLQSVRNVFSVDAQAGDRLVAQSGQRLTLTPGIHGEVVYVRDGDYASFNGRAIRDAIVVMDFSSGRNYLNAVTLGAQAVIFVEDGTVTRVEAEDKFIHVPVDVPRFWAQGETAERLKEQGSRAGNIVTLNSRMEWTAVESYNIYGRIAGTRQNRPEDTVVLEAYYDANSVVPARAYGAESAGGIVTLLSVAESFSTPGNAPELPILFLATSGHHNSLAGITDWLYRHRRNEEDFLEQISPDEFVDFGLFVGLDISSQNDQVATFAQGTFYTGWNTDSRRTNMHTGYGKAFMLYASELYPNQEMINESYPQFVDAIAPPKRSWRTFMPVMMAFDHEPANYVGLSAITMATTNDIRARVDTPVDTLGLVDIDKVVTQARTVAGLIHRGVRDRGFFQETKIKPKDTQRELTGRILQFNREKSFMPNTPIPQAVVAINMGSKSYCGVRGLMTTLTNAGPGDNLERARFTLCDTIATDQEPSELGRFRYHMTAPHINQVEVRGYKLSDDGRIMMAPDLGEEGDKTYPLLVGMGNPIVQTLQVLFECRALSLFEIVDSRYLSALDVANVRGADGSELRSYGYDMLLKQSTKEGDVEMGAVIYAQPGTMVKVMLSTDLFGIKYLLLNSPQSMFDNPPMAADISAEDQMMSEGIGYPIGMGVVDRPAWRVARDMWIIDQVRMQTLARFGVTNQRVSMLHEQAQRALVSADSAYANMEYDKFISYSRRAWGLEARGYPDVKGTALDTVQGVVFYFALLLPFAFFMERLLIGAVDVRKQILGFSAIFVGIFFILQFVHPAFKLSTSPYVIFLGFIIFALGAIVTVIVVGRFNWELKRMKMAASGMHETDVGRLEATAAAIKLGINNLRKRPTRTGLTAVTIAILTFSVLSFTSVVTTLQFYKLDRGNEPRYQGMLVRDRNWVGLQSSVVEYVESAFRGRAQITPRMWFTSQLRADKPFLDFVNVDNGMRSFAAGAMGILPQEREVTGLGADSMMIAGRWLEEGDRNVCVVPSSMASLVGITREDVGTATLDMLGNRWRVIGMINDTLMRNLTDLDDEILTPVDLVAEQSRMDEGQKDDPTQVTTAEVQTFTHTAPATVIILPFVDVEDMGGVLRSVAVNNFVDRNMFAMTSRDNPADFVRYDVAYTSGGATAETYGIVGVTPSETAITGINRNIVAGRWFSDSDTQGCVVTRRLAGELGLQADGTETIRILEQDLNVIGVIDTVGSLVTGMSMAISADMPGDVVLVPKALCASIAAGMPAELEGGPVSVYQQSDMIKDIEAFMSRVALTTFVGYGNTVEVYSSLGATSIKGLSNLGVPIIVAALIVLNTMLGAVYDRKREIGIFATVGLTPFHIAALFVAEAAVFAVIGAVWGYLIGQVLAMVLSFMGALEGGGLSLNYSSISAVSSTIIVMITVLVSSLYPAKVAADSAVPDVTRQWSFPPAEGDYWFFEFPFTVGQADVVGLYAYLAKVLESYGAGSTGEFVAQDVHLEGMTEKNDSGVEEDVFRLAFRTWLAPYDLGISQDVRMDAKPTIDEGIFKIDMMIHRLSGDVASWQRINRGFMNVMRKRFLVWRTIPPMLKEQYMDRGRRIFAGEEVEDFVEA